MPGSGSPKTPADGGVGPASPVVRPSTEADLPAIRAIYAHHVRHGLSSFEEEPPGLDELGRRRTATIARGLPHIVANLDGGVVGFAYAGPYRPRPAYRYAVEDTVYVAPEATRRGAGRALLGELVARCTALGYRQMIAVIGDSANTPSIGLHEALGFRRIGVLCSVGFKFGRWVDCVVLQYSLGEGASTPPRDSA